ncbi:hypothetical protein N7532_010018 [Penicillium argentinense]|uniref:Integrase catalytic domain-containing protein n=1 Tax=Penicillium argentinense TaxID=1131581 RepID=A0A9W9JY32_9EURO|nr:uncharacterized protein N7532_010018 [Penicillium argentinense]KAJ5085247.1 hypothetical protein N7532_010018 [Penicillium argentinense]
MESSVIAATQSVKLRTSADWIDWIRAIRDAAETDRVWEFIDPDTPESILPKPRECPEPPSPEANATAIDLYKINYQRWDREERGLANIKRVIMATIEAAVRDQLYDKPTVYGCLVTLRDRYSDSGNLNEEYRQDMYNAVYPPRKGEDVKAFVRRWERMRDRMIAIGETQMQFNKDFLLAVKHLAPMWYTQQLRPITIESIKMDNSVLANDFLAHYREHYGNAPAPAPPTNLRGNPAPRSTFSTLQDSPEASPDLASTTNSANKKRRSLKDVPIAERWCPCGKKDHKPWECPYLNERKRSANWSANWRAQGKINRILKDHPEWKEFIDKEIKLVNQHDSAENRGTALGTWPMTTLALNCLNQKPHLRDEWVFDTAAHRHICVDRDSFIDYIPDESVVKTADSVTRILGYGTAVMHCVDPRTGSRNSVKLHNACYLPTFQANLVSYGCAKERGCQWDEMNNCMRDPRGIPFARVAWNESAKLWLFDKPQGTGGTASSERECTAEYAMAARRSTAPRTSEALLDVCHRILGHIHPKTVKKTAEMVEGVKIKDPESTCITEFPCQAFLYLATRFLKIPLVGIHSDNERSVTTDTEQELEGIGFVVTHTVVHSAEMNGPGERSGGVIIQKARNLRIEGQLPEALWPEMVYAAVYILNRTPTRIEDGRWIIPWDEARSHLDQTYVRSHLSCLRLYGSLTYCRTPNIPRSHKLRPRAEVGFLVGYQASNVWRVWMPLPGRIQSVRDAVFDESCRWYPGMQYWEEHPLLIPETRDILNDREEWRVIHREIGLPDDWIKTRIGPDESGIALPNPAPVNTQTVSEQAGNEEGGSEEDREEAADREATPAPTHVEAAQQYTPPPTVEKPSRRSNRSPALPEFEDQQVNQPQQQQD